MTSISGKINGILLSQCGSGTPQYSLIYEESGGNLIDFSHIGAPTYTLIYEKNAENVR